MGKDDFGKASSSARVVPQQQTSAPGISIVVELRHAGFAVDVDVPAPADGVGCHQLSHQPAIILANFQLIQYKFVVRGCLPYLKKYAENSIQSSIHPRMDYKKLMRLLKFMRLTARQGLKQLHGTDHIRVTAYLFVHHCAHGRFYSNEIIFLQFLEKRTNYSDDEKLEIVEKLMQMESAHSGELDKTVAKQLGLNFTTIYAWKRELSQTKPQHKHSHNEQKELMKRYYDIKDKNPKFRDEDIAKMLKIGRRTLYTWKKQFKRQQFHQNSVDGHEHSVEENAAANVQEIESSNSWSI
ncbi:hypothetical protein GPALN_010325 [Globodera pallida]|nr:hypothetical protein GPALN_010325 [Globodera pallida]